MSKFYLQYIMMKKFNFNDSFFKHVIHFSGQLYFVSNLQLSFAPEQLSALSTFNVLLITTMIWTFCFGLQWVVSKIKTFHVLLFLTKLYLKMSNEYYNAYELVPFYESRLEDNFIQTLLFQPKTYSRLFEVTTEANWIIVFPLKTSSRFVKALTLTSYCLYFASVAVLNNFLKSWR